MILNIMTKDLARIRIYTAVVPSDPEFSRSIGTITIAGKKHTYQSSVFKTLDNIAESNRDLETLEGLRDIIKRYYP